MVIFFRMDFRSNHHKQDVFYYALPATQISALTEFSFCKYYLYRTACFADK